VDISALALAAGGGCSDGVISGSTSSGTYKISLYDDAGAQLTCADQTWRNQVARLKSEGTAGNTVRAVEVAVAAVKRSAFPGYPDALKCEAAGVDGGGGYTVGRDTYLFTAVAKGKYQTFGVGDYQSGLGIGEDKKISSIIILGRNGFSWDCGVGTDVSTIEAAGRTFYYSDSN
jgi:hypothetical protein